MDGFLALFSITTKPEKTLNIALLQYEKDSKNAIMAPPLRLTPRNIFD